MFPLDPAYISPISRTSRLGAQRARGAALSRQAALAAAAAPPAAPAAPAARARAAPVGSGLFGVRVRVRRASTAQEAAWHRSMVSIGRGRSK